MEKINDLSKNIKIELKNVKVLRWTTGSQYEGMLFIDGKRIGNYDVEANTRKEAIEQIIREITTSQYIICQKNKIKKI